MKRIESALAHCRLTIHTAAKIEAIAMRFPVDLIMVLQDEWLTDLFYCRNLNTGGMISSQNVRVR